MTIALCILGYLFVGMVVAAIVVKVSPETFDYEEDPGFEVTKLIGLWPLFLVILLLMSLADAILRLFGRKA